MRRPALSHVSSRRNLPKRHPLSRAALLHLVALSSFALLIGCTSRTEKTAARNPAPRWAVRVLNDGPFQGGSVGFGGETPTTAVAFAKLVAAEDGLEEFRKLLDSKYASTKLYGLCGLWHLDRPSLPRAIANLGVEKGAILHYSTGCIGGEYEVHEFVAGSIVSGKLPKELRRSGAGWLKEVDSKGHSCEYWIGKLAEPKQASDAAGVLAYSFYEEAIPTLLARLPSESEEFQCAAIEVFESLGPWDDHSAASLREALLSSNDIVIRAAALGLRRVNSIPPTDHSLQALRTITADTTIRRDPCSAREYAMTDLLLLLSRSEPPAPLGELLKLVRHPLPELRDSISREWLYSSLYAEQPKAAVRLLQPCLEHEEEDVRQFTIDLLVGALFRAKKTDVHWDFDEFVAPIKKSCRTLHGEPELLDWLDEALSWDGKTSRD